MKSKVICLLALLILFGAKEGLTMSDSWQASGQQGAVVAGGQGAVNAGMEILQNGGNAIDSSIATLLALTVTDHRYFCFGSEVPIMIYDADRKVVELVAGQGVAPKLATLEYFQALEDGIPGKGIEPAAVPGLLDACLVALDRYGTITFGEAAAPMLGLLDQHKAEWHAQLAVTVRRVIEAEQGSPDDRSRGLRLAADYFYRGPIAREIDAWMKANGGLIRYSDMATHTTRIEDPLSIDYRGYTIYKCGPWTQGPYLLQTMELLEPYDLKGLGKKSPQGIHLVIEAMKLSLADRDVYYADPLFTEVPMDELLAETYTNLRRELIDPNQASMIQRPGDPVKMKKILAEERTRFGLGGPDLDTTTCAVVDGKGNMVAATPSGWSGVLVGDTGIWLGTRLQSFNTWEGHPNVIEPGKRPRITLTPTLVLKAGEPVLGISVAGGDGQDQSAIEMLINVIDFGMTIEEAVTAPTYMTSHFVNSFRQAPPGLGKVTVYPEDYDAEVVAELEARGHIVTKRGSPLWHTVMVSRNPQTGELKAAGDPVVDRHAAAY